MFQQQSCNPDDIDTIFSFIFLFFLDLILLICLFHVSWWLLMPFAINRSIALEHGKFFVDQGWWKAGKSQYQEYCGILDWQAVQAVVFPLHGHSTHYRLFLIQRNSTTCYDCGWNLVPSLQKAWSKSHCYPIVILRSQRSKIAGLHTPPTTRNYLLSICVINRNQNIHSERHGNTITTFHFSLRSHFYIT